jgi:outer membrane protein assembly factor BamA
MAMISAEVRIPFTGPKQLSLIGSQYLFTDLAFFFDAGMAFDEFSHISDGKPYNVGGQTVFIKPELAMSVGASVRINLFGAMILEPYWAYPLQTNSSIVFGLNFIPGW